MISELAWIIKAIREDIATQTIALMMLVFAVISLIKLAGG